MGLKQKHIQAMQKYSWPGNVRELQNVIERAVIISQGGRLKLDIPSVVSLDVSKESVSMPENHKKALIVGTYEELDKLERQMIVEALREADGKISGRNSASERLGIHPSTLTSKMPKLNIKRKYETDFE